MIQIDMDMPENCEECFALDDYGDYPMCKITSETRGYNFNTRDRKMDRCPLRPVVTCGECRHYERGGNEAKTRVPCMDTTYPKDFYCGRGEKKCNS